MPEDAGLCHAVKFMLIHTRSVTPTTLLVALVGFSAAACTGNSSALAPSGSVLTVKSAAQAVVAQDSTAIVLQLKQLDGSPAPDGTEIVVGASAGTLDRNKVATAGGRAEVMFTASADPGAVRISAASGEVSTSLSLSVLAAPATLELTAEPASLPAGGGTTTISARVVGPDGAPVAGLSVAFDADGAPISPASTGVTDDTGSVQVEVELTATATVSVTSGGLTNSVAVEVAAPALPTLDLSLTPEAPAAGVPVTITATLTASGEPAEGEISLTFGDGSTGTLGPVQHVATIEHTYAAAGGYNLTGHVKVPDGREFRHTIRVEVAAAPSATAHIGILVSPARPVAGQPATIDIELTLDGLPAVADVSIATGDGATLTVGTVDHRGSASHTYAAAGGYNLSVNAAFRDGPSIRETIRVDVDQAATTPPPAAPPPAGPTNPGDPIDLNSVTFLHSDVSSWSVTSTVTNVSVSRGSICIEHTKSGRWPVLDNLEGNPWVFAQINGRWHAWTWEWLRPGQTCKSSPDTGDWTTSLGPHGERDPANSWRPQSGELVGFMVSTHGRDGRRTSNERSNIVMVRWP